MRRLATAIYGSAYQRATTWTGDPMRLLWRRELRKLCRRSARAKCWPFGAGHRHTLLGKMQRQQTKRQLMAAKPEK